MELYQETGKSTNAIEPHRELNRLKKTEYPWRGVQVCASGGAAGTGSALCRLFPEKEGRKVRATVGCPRFRGFGRKVGPG